MGEFNLKKIQVRNNLIITTADRLNVEEHIELEHDKATGLLYKNMAEANNAHKLVQRVINVGPMVRDIKEGDWVRINPLYYKNRHLEEQENDINADINEIHKKEVYGPDYEFPTIMLDGIEHLILFDRDIEYIILDAVDTDGRELHSEH